MSVADVMGQIGEIQARLALLTPAAPGSADGGSGFASALSGATAADGTAATAASGAVGSGSGATGSDVVQAALQYKGVPYVLGGESRSGIDCSGLVQAAYKDVGVSVPRLVHEQQTIGQPVASLKDAKPGDLVVLNGGDHVAIWMGNDTVIHAPYPGRTVSVQKAWFSDKDVVTIRRVLPSADAATSSGTSAPLAGATAATSTGGVSPATAARAIGMLGEAGALGGTSSDPSTSGSSLSSLLATLSAGSSSTPATSGTTAQQLLAARTALLSTEA